MNTPAVVTLASLLLMPASELLAQSTIDLQLRYQQEVASDSGRFETKTRAESWPAEQTAVIVCDCWDAHHCLNAVRRLEQFAPTLNRVLQAARRRGATIIHAPSDCMDAYRQHPARQRAIDVPQAEFLPYAVEAWCSVIPAEERSVYPIDQSDGGEDDDPAEHQQWRAELESMGRNPNMPWQKQSELIEIDAEQDFISDRGDEVWNILQQRGIQNVILTGVHTNMCVLGRPFGLRQMARHGKHVVLMRDLTDTMYNPERWPYVNHFEGTRRVIAHIERFVCPTVTSDQIIGGQPFRFQGDEAEATTRSADGATTPDPTTPDPTTPDPTTPDPNAPDHWTPVAVPHRTHPYAQPGWYRAVVMIPASWLETGIRLKLTGQQQAEVWCNGQDLKSTVIAKDTEASWDVPSQLVEAGDWNLLVIKVPPGGSLRNPPVLVAGQEQLSLRGRWQFRSGETDFSSMPLPAKFGGSPDVAYSPPEPLWTARPLTRRGEFTPGIEGPACDAAGNIFAVNYAQQGTIGRVRPDGVGEIFVKLPGQSVGNGIRFANDGTFYVADYVEHNILCVDPETREVTVFAHHDGMHQPNDLAIAPDGTLYASDPNWSAGTGQVWRIDVDGSVKQIATELGTTNGIEVSPDGKTLYVNESKQRNVWAFTIRSESLSDKRLIRQFDDHGFDGMRCDVDGNLYLTRYGKGTVVKLTPQGEILREIPVLGARPSNLCFGGPDRRTIYVTEVESTRLVSFRVDRPGR